MTVKDFYAYQGNILMSYYDNEKDETIVRGIGIITKFFSDGFITVNPRTDGNIEINIVRLAEDKQQFTSRIIPEEDYDKHYTDFQETREFINENAKKKRNSGN